MQGQVGHQGAAMTQAIPASLKLVGEPNTVILVGVKNQEATVVGEGGGGASSHCWGFSGSWGTGLRQIKMEQSLGGGQR